MLIQKLKDLGLQSVVHERFPMSHKLDGSLAEVPFDPLDAGQRGHSYPDRPRIYSRVGRDNGRLRTLDTARLLDLAMRDRALHHYRQQTIETARGLVLEIGVGSGLNLPSTIGQ